MQHICVTVSFDFHLENSVLILRQTFNQTKNPTHVVTSQQDGQQVLVVCEVNLGRKMIITLTLYNSSIHTKHKEVECGCNNHSLFEKDDLLLGRVRIDLPWNIPCAVSRVPIGQGVWFRDFSFYIFWLILYGRLYFAWIKDGNSIFV
jgi:hypothetical protein